MDDALGKAETTETTSGIKEGGFEKKYIRPDSSIVKQTNEENCTIMNRKPSSKDLIKSKKLIREDLRGWVVPGNDLFGYENTIVEYPSGKKCL